jgi:hypothetical protein
VEGDRRAVGVEEDAPWRAPRWNQRETTWQDAIFEQPLSFAEHQRKDPGAIFIDKFGGDQRLQQPHFSCEMRYGWAVTHSLRPDSLRRPT